MHPLLEWIRASEGDQPMAGRIGHKDVAEELEHTPLADGYEPEDPDE